MLFDFPVEGQELLRFSAFTKQIDINVSVDIAMHCIYVALKKSFGYIFAQKRNKNFQNTSARLVPTYFFPGKGDHF